MVYNDKYFFEFATLKTADKTQLYYKVVFSLKEDIPVVYDQIELKASNSPFVLSYKAAEDFAFSPFRVSSAEINIFYPLNAAEDVPQPEAFFTSLDDFSWRVQLYETTDNGDTFQLKWQGFLITSDVQYEWQDVYYYRLTATDNLAVLKDVKYSREDYFAMRPYTPNQGAEMIDFISELLLPSQQNLNITVACNWKNDNVTKTFEDIVTSKYAAINWETGEPWDCYTILSKLISGLGCTLEQSNIDASWLILNPSELATTTGSVIPTTVYDYEGTEIDTGTIDFSDTIQRGGDFAWRDKNQIVTLKRPIGYVKMLFPYRRKNLLKNYGFQDDQTALSADWATVGAFSTTTSVMNPNTLNRYEQKFDKVITEINEWENFGSTLFLTNYLKNNIDLLETDLNSVENPSARGVYYFFYIKFNYVVGGNSFSADGDGFNFQLVVDSGASVDNFYYDNTNPMYAGIGIGGLFITSDYGRIAEFITTYRQSVVCAVKTTEASIQALNSVELRFLPLRRGDGSSTEAYIVDNLEINISQTKWKQLKELGFYASIGGFKNNPMEIKDAMFQGGTDELDFWFFEDCIGVKVTPDVVTRPQSNILWTRPWEILTESNNETLTQKICKNILSFYRKNSRKFTGNVYGDYMTFPKYFAIEGAVNNTAKSNIEDAFTAMVEEDAGTVETTYCGSDFLGEFFEAPSKFLSIEMSIDYANSTTLVNLHEDHTSTSEVNFESGTSHTYQQGGVFGQATGGNINSQQQTISSGGG